MYADIGILIANVLHIYFLLNGVFEEAIALLIHNFHRRNQGQIPCIEVLEQVNLYIPNSKFIGLSIGISEIGQGPPHYNSCRQ